MGEDHDRDLALALRLADVADAVTMAHFRSSSLAHELKADGSPVSEADRACEEAIRATLASERPGDVILGEEIGGPASPGGRRWIVDGIDGTVLYVAGRRGWATEIALEVDGSLVVGVCTAPSLGRRFWGSAGGGAFADGEPLRVSTTSTLAEAACSALPPVSVMAERHRPAADVLVDACGRYADAVGHCALEVAVGTVDVGYQPSGGPWDFAALAVIVEAAGGRFSDLRGERRIDGGGPVLYSNGAVHDAAVDLYRRTGTTSTTAL